MLQGSKWKQTDANEFYGEDQVREVLSVCGINFGTELDTHYLIFCPFHNNRNTPACEIDKEKGLFICFSCGERGTLLDLVMRTTNRTYFEASRVISSAAKSQDFTKTIEKAIEDKPDFVEFDSETISRLHNTLIENERASSYFANRGIDKSAIRFFNLGYSDKQDMVTVPVYTHENMCVGFVARSVEGKAFKNSTGLPRNKVLFNLNNVKYQRFAIVESSFDVIRLWQLNIPAVATLGSNLGKQQIDLIKKYSNGIIIASDTDDAGDKLKDNLIKNINNVSILEFPEGCKDIGDMTDEQIINQFNIVKTFDLALSL